MAGFSAPPRSSSTRGELEKKFSGKAVVFNAQCRILPKPTREAIKLKQKQPISHTLANAEVQFLHFIEVL